MDRFQIRFLYIFFRDFFSSFSWACCLISSLLTLYTYTHQLIDQARGLLKSFNHMINNLEPAWTLRPLKKEKKQTNTPVYAYENTCSKMKLTLHFELLSIHKHTLTHTHTLQWSTRTRSADKYKLTG